MMPGMSAFFPPARRLLSRRCALVSALLISACATAPQQSSEPPDVDYVPDAGYSMLMAEIALQRKQWLIAAREYLHAANQSQDPATARRATEFAVEYGYDAMALAGSRRWLELLPENPLAHEYAGRLYLRRNALDQALIHWRASLGTDVMTDAEYLRVGADMAEAGNPIGATALLIRLVNERPDQPGLRMALAYAALRSGAYELSLQSARRVEAEVSDWVQPRLIVPKALLSLGREYEAFAYLDDALAAEPSSTLELERIRLLSAVGRHADAMRGLRELMRVYGVQSELLRLRGTLLLAAGEVDAAERDFEQLLSNSSHVYESYFTLARIATSREDFGRAIGYFGRIRGGPYLVRAQLGISFAYQRIGDDDSALEQLRTFAGDYPGYAFDVLDSEARLLFRMGEVDAALQLYETATRLRPDRVSLLLEYGSLLDLAGRHDEALAIMRRAVAVNPLDANALNTLGYTLTNRTGRHDEAHRLIRRALELDADSAPVIDSMGWVLFNKGRVDEARSFLELALAKMDDPELIAHLGEVYWVGGDRDRALELWERGLVDYPDSQPLIETRQRFSP